MENNNQNPKRKGPSGKAVFIEYSSANKGQHFLTIMANRRVVARVWKEYYPELNRYVYTAKGPDNVEVHEPTENLYELKKWFTERIRNATQILPPPIIDGGEYDKDNLPEDLKKYQREQATEKLHENKTVVENQSIEAEQPEEKKRNDELKKTRSAKEANQEKGKSR